MEREGISKLLYEAEARACKAYAHEQMLKAKIDERPTLLGKMNTYWLEVLKYAFANEGDKL